MPKLWRRSRALAQFCLPLIFSRVAILVLAGVVVVSLFIPWHQAAPRTYPGLDPNLLYINSKGTGTQSGDVRISGDRAVLTAREASAPALHLVSSETDFSAEFDVTPSKTIDQWQTARVNVQPPQGTSYYAVLVGATGGTILFRSIALTPVSAGSSSPPAIFADDFTNPKNPIWYPAPGVDRGTGSGMQITAPGKQEVGTYTRIVGLAQPQSTYVISGQFRSVVGVPNFKIAIDWLDSQQRHISYGANWSAWAPFQQPLVPATISVWHPRRNYAISLEFTGALKPKIEAVTRDTGGSVSTQELADYEAGKTYHVVVTWMHAQNAAFRVTGPDRKTVTYSIGRQSGFGLFSDPFANLSIGTSAPLGATSSLEISQVKLIIPAHSRFAQSVSDWRLTLLTWVIVLWLLAYVSAYFITQRLGRRSGLPSFRGAVARLIRWRSLVVLASLGALCALYAAATVIDGHPFDRLSQESWAYVINQYGIGALYGRSSAIPDSIVRGGTGPWSPAEYAYPPGMVNFFVVVAKSWQAVHGSIVPMANSDYYTFWKFAFAFFILVTAGLIFAISRRLNSGSLSWPLILAAVLALSPAVIFDVAVWGESNALLWSALLLAVWALVVDRPRLMWSAIVISVLIKQTALLVVPLVALYALRRYGLRRSLTYGAFGLVAGFGFIAPSLLAGYSPVTAALPTIGKVADFGSPLSSYDTTVAADTFPVWVVLTGVRGLHGMARLWTSDRETVPLLGMTYSSAGLVLFILVALVAAWAVWREAGRQPPSYQRLFVSIALVIVGYVCLNTRTSGHYLILALPFLLLGLPRAARVRAFWKVAAVSALAIISEYGLFMVIAVRGEWPNFAVLGSPSTNTFSGLVYAIYTYDGFITLFAVLMFFVMVRLLLEVATDLRRRVTVPAHVTPEGVRETAGAAV